MRVEPPQGIRLEVFNAIKDLISRCMSDCYAVVGEGSSGTKVMAGAWVK